MADITALDLEPLAALLDPSYPERLREIAEALYTVMLQDERLQALGRAHLAEMALAQTEHLSQTLGGGNFYMHKGTGFRLSQRDREMCARFNGHNYAQLARDYQRSEMRVRQIIDTWQRAEFNRRQGGLFAAADSGAREMRGHKAVNAADAASP